MVHTLPVKVKRAMLNIAEQPGIQNARRNGLRQYLTRNNFGGSSAEETAAGQCRRLAGHRPVSVTEEETRTGGYGRRYQALLRFQSQVGWKYGLAIMRISTIKIRKMPWRIPAKVFQNSCRLDVLVKPQYVLRVEFLLDLPQASIVRTIGGPYQLFTRVAQLIDIDSTRQGLQFVSQ